MKFRLLAALLALAACSGEPSALISTGQIIGDTIPAPLTVTPGSVDRGVLIFSNRDQGHCVLCHVVEGLQTPFQGNVGPDLTDIGSRLSDAQLRLRIVDYQIVRPGTLMPSYYRKHDLYQVQKDYGGTTILTAQQVEDLVSYLSQLEQDDANDE